MNVRSFLFLFLAFAPMYADSTPQVGQKDQAPVTLESSTFSMIKPRAVREGHTGEILAALEKQGFHIRALRMRTLTKEEAERFYKEHEGKPFFSDLVSKMTSGPIVTMVLSKKGAVHELRGCIGATDPKKAAPDTIRARFGIDVTENAIHASDSPLSAQREIAFFFAPNELEG